LLPRLSESAPQEKLLNTHYEEDLSGGNFLSIQRRLEEDVETLQAEESFESQTLDQRAANARDALDHVIRVRAVLLAKSPDLDTRERVRAITEPIVAKTADDEKKAASNVDFM